MRNRIYAFIAFAGLCSLLPAQQSLARAEAATAAAPANSSAQARLNSRETVKFAAPIMVQKPVRLTPGSADGRCPPSNPPAPCFRDIADPLDGRHTIYEIDDLLTVSWRTNQNFQIDYLPTVNSATSDVQHVPANPPGVTELWSTRPVTGRMSDISADTLVVAIGGANDQNQQIWLSLHDPIHGFRTVPVPIDKPAYRPWALQSADFNGDGHADLAMSYSLTDGTQVLRIGLKAQTPQEFTWQPEKLKTPAIGEITVGDFNDDGTPDIAALMPGASGKGLRVQIYLVTPSADGASVQIGDALDYPLDLLPADNGQVIALSSMTAGRFSATTHDQLALVYARDFDTPKIVSLAFTVDEAKKAIKSRTQQGPVDTQVQLGHAALPMIRSGRFAGQPYDQAAVMVGNSAEQGGGGVRVGIIGFNAALYPSLSPGNANDMPMRFPYTPGGCPVDLVVGNFDHRQANKFPPPATLASLEPQIAVLVANCGGDGAGRLMIVDVAVDTKQNADPGPAFKLTEASTHTFEKGYGGRPGLYLAKGDWQGRSVQLGAPTKITLENRTQAEMILALPPMHVDWVKVKDSSGAEHAAAARNFSAVPTDLFVNYQSADSSSLTVSDTNTTSWSWGAKETTNFGATVGDCEAGPCEKVDWQGGAQQALDRSQADLNGTFKTLSNTWKTTTGFADQVAFNSQTSTIYVYPVIGRTVCPSSKPDCSEAEKVPLVMNVAGADTANQDILPAGMLPWYQPVWMPGNIFSYPGSLQQLQAAAFPGDAGSLQPLISAASTAVGGANNTSDTTVETHWTRGSETDGTKTSNNNFSFSTEISYMNKAEVELFGGVEGSGKFETSGSYGFSNLHDSKTTLSQSKGIQFTNRVQGTSDDYAYLVSPLVFGQERPGGVVDNQSLSSDISTFSAIRMGHFVSFGQGSATCCDMWSKTYDMPDLGLNQPEHWVVDISNSPDGACRSTSSGGNACFQLGQRVKSDNPGGIWGSQFHFLRGLFVQGPAGAGPQLGIATAGDQLVLSARVYNLSLAEMPADARIHVRFMAMPWNPQSSGNGAASNTPAGPSFLIGERSDISPIPAFNDGPTPNWTLVTQTFDTSGNNCGGKPCDKQYLVFWVAVWAVDGNGSLITEMPGHGFTSIPSANDDFLDVVQREETYSNNLGLYNSVFHILGKSAATAKARILADAAAASVRPTQPKPEPKAVRARLAGMGAESGTLKLGERTMVAARVKVGSEDLTSGLTVKFYDGHPDRGGRVFGLQQYPYLAAGKTYDFRTGYRPQECGRHLIFAQVGDETGHEHMGRLLPVRVNCTPAQRQAQRDAALAKRLPMAFVPH